MQPSAPIAADPWRPAPHSNADLLGALFDEPPPVMGPRQLGDYELLEEVASGGMGVVWRARQRSLNRIVALKTIRAAHLARRADVLRFRAEATAAACLRHPGIVTIHDIGEEDGQHFFTMELVEGPNLARRLREGSLAPVRAATMLRDIARAVQHAHECGILHRDIKPSNILLRADDQPCVSDFGLAKALAHDSELTLSGTVLGSPSYMPPEQALGRVQDLDARGDVYALGATLYEALTGIPPFQGESPVQTLKHVVENDPVAPRLHSPEIPRDLETICLKCLAKDPSRRYATAGALAQDLDRFLRGEPPRARPMGMAGRLARWAGRKPALATTAAALVLAVLVGTLGVLYQWHRAVQGEALLRQTAYDTAMLLANHALQERNYGLVTSLLEQTLPENISGPDLRGWEWRYLKRETRSDELFKLGQHNAAVCALAISPGGKTVVSASLADGLKVWNFGTRQMLATRPALNEVKSIVFSPQGSLLAVVGSEGTVTLLDAEGWQRRLAFSLGSDITGVQFSADERRIFIADTTRLRTYSLPEGTEIASERVPGNAAACMDAAAEVLALATLGSTLYFTDRHADRPPPVSWPYPHGTYLTAIIPFPQSSRLATAFSDHSVLLWDIPEARQLLTLRHHTENVSAVALDERNQRVATAGGDQVIVLSSLQDGARLDTLKGHGSVVQRLAFSADGARLLSGGSDGTVRVWDVTIMHQESASFSIPPGYRRCSLSGNAARLFQTFDDGRCVVTNLLLPNQLISAWREPELSFAKLSSAGEFLLVARADGDLELRQQRGSNFVQLGSLQLQPRPPVSILWNATDDQVATIWDDGEVAVLDRKPFKQRTRFRLPLPLSAGWKVANFSPNGRWLICSLRNGETVVWDWAAGRANFTWPAEPRELMDATVSPDGKTAATVREGGPVVIWSLNAGAPPRELARLVAESPWPRAVAFSSDNRRLVVGSESGAVTVLNVATRLPVATLRANDLPVYRIWFHAPEDKLATFSPGAIGLWRAGDR